MQLKMPWLVSYDAAPEIMVLYEGSTNLRYNLSYSAAARYSGEEIMFASPGLILPDVQSPAKIAESVVSAQRVRLSNLTLAV